MCTCMFNSLYSGTEARQAKGSDVNSEHLLEVKRIDSIEHKERDSDLVHNTHIITKKCDWLVLAMWVITNLAPRRLNRS